MLLSSVITEITIISPKILHLLNFTLSPREWGKKKKKTNPRNPTLYCVLVDLKIISTVRKENLLWNQNRILSFTLNLLFKSHGNLK